MNRINEKVLESFISENVITPFYIKRSAKLKELSLEGILKRKNPYLFKAKNIQTAEEFTRYILDAFLSSQEETIFGSLMENLAIFVCEKAFGGKKAEEGMFSSVDLIFEKDGKTYIVGIKSGPVWGNKDQVDRMKGNFAEAKKVLRKRGTVQKIIAVNGCIYGKDNNPYKKDSKNKDRNYYKFCGEEFWEFVSGDKDFFQKIILPIDKEAKIRDEDFKKAYFAKINELTKQFSHDYLLKDNQIDWAKIVDFVSKKKN